MAVFNFKKLRKNNTQYAWFLFDVFMVILAIININLIIFDFTFSYSVAQKLYETVWPAFTIWYKNNIHENFVYIDLVFVLIFFIEFTLRWIISLKNKEYQKWFFYPFANWYDLLGLIPIGSFRFLRVLRIVSIIIRLQKMGVLRLQESSFYPFVNKYYNVLIEEVSDRVVMHVLDGVKTEMQGGEDITHQFLERVIKPNNERMVHFAMEKSQLVTQQIVQRNLPEIKNYLFEKVQAAVNDNAEMKMIKAVPGLGGVIRKQLDHAIADITYKVISGIMEDIAQGNGVLMHDIQHITQEVLDSLEQDDALEDMIKSMTNETIEIVKKQVAKKKWQAEEKL